MNVCSRGNMGQKYVAILWNHNMPAENLLLLFFSNEPRICRTHTGELAAEDRPAAVVWGRRWVSPSLRCHCLHSSLFPKKRRGELGPGRTAAAIIGKLAEIPLPHTQSADESAGTRTVGVAVEGDLRRNATAIATNSALSRVRARPAQHYVGTTMDRIIIEKATWWTEEKTAKQLFARLNFSWGKAFAWTALDCSIAWDICISSLPSV